MSVHDRQKERQAARDADREQWFESIRGETHWAWSNYDQTCFASQLQWVGGRVS